jgi:2-polyprenyl-3-methyl-5-hydroxy-6-metoxy-1,4-benzoquinol methylase
MSHAVVTILLDLLGIVILASIAISLIKGAPPVPSNKRAIATFLSIAKEYQRKNVADLGAGDGRIVKALATQNVEVHGYEINPLLVWWGTWRLRSANLHNKGFMHIGNLWKQNLKSFDLVIIYGLPNIMKNLESKLEKELQPGTLVASNSFPLPTWKPIKKIGKVYLYEKTYL